MIKTSNYCRLCNYKKLSKKLILKPIPLSEKFNSKPFNKNSLKNFPISLGHCENCKSVQTNEVVSPNLLWSDFTYLSGQTKFIVNHFKNLADQFKKRFDLKKNDLILDIGSNDGTFLNFFKKKGMKVVGVDPAKNLATLANKKGIFTYGEFFNNKTIKKIKRKYKKKAKLILCFNTFAHSENLRDIVKNIHDILDERGVFVFECQYLRDIYDKKILGTIFHEHMYHHSISSLSNLFDYFNLNLYDAKLVNIQKGSILGFVTKNKSKNKTKEILKLKNIEKKKGYISNKKFDDLRKFINHQKKKAKRIIKQFDKNKIGSYGSARSGPTYALNFSLSKCIKFIFDDHPLKVNKFTSFLNIKVLPTKDISKIKPFLLIILAYLHSKKIIKSNLNYLKNGGAFLLVYPEIILINKKNYKKFI